MTQRRSAEDAEGASALPELLAKLAAVGARR